MTRNGSAPVAAVTDVAGLRILSVEDILSAEDLPSETVPVPEWGGAVTIRGFSKAREFAIRQEAMGADGLDEERFEMLLFINGVVEPQFSVDQLEVLKEKSGSVIDRVLTRIMDISGLSKEAQERAKARFPEGR